MYDFENQYYDYSEEAEKDQALYEQEQEQAGQAAHEANLEAWEEAGRELEMVEDDDDEPF